MLFKKQELTNVMYWKVTSALKSFTKFYKYDYLQNCYSDKDNIA